MVCVSRVVFILVKCKWLCVYNPRFVGGGLWLFEAVYSVFDDLEFIH